MGDKSTISEPSNLSPHDVERKTLDMPPIWFLMGAHFGVAILILGGWIAFGTVWGNIGKVIGSVILGPAVIVAMLGTAIQMTAHEAISKLDSCVHARRSLFGYGVAFVVLSTLLSLGICWGASLIIDSFLLADFSARTMAYVATGLLAIIGSTSITMRILALSLPTHRLKTAR